MLSSYSASAVPHNMPLLLFHSLFVPLTMERQERAGGLFKATLATYRVLASPLYGIRLKVLDSGVPRVRNMVRISKDGLNFLYLLRDNARIESSVQTELGSFIMAMWD